MKQRRLVALLSFKILILFISKASAESLCNLLPDLAKNPAWSTKLNSQDRIDYILIDKSRRMMHLMDQSGLLKTYRIALGKKPNGAKTCSGDNKTPEGIYRVEYKNSQSDYHLSLKISYPNIQDILRAKRAGCDAGGDTMIHGLPNDLLKRLFIRHPKDWTKGCAAVTNKQIEEIFAIVETGTPIELCK